MGNRILNRVWRTSKAKGAALIVLVALADWADDHDGSCYPGLDMIARRTRLTRPGVIAALRHLERLGEIESIKRGHHPPEGGQATNLYRVVVGNVVDVNVVDVNVVDVNDVSKRCKRRSEKDVNVAAKLPGLSLNDPSVDPLVDPSGEKARPTAAELVSHWNAQRQPGPKVTQLTEQRKRAYDRALAQSPQLSDWSTAVAWLNTQKWANAPGGAGEHATWRADLDWLAKPGQLAKVLDRARTDEIAPPQPPRRPGDIPTERLTDADRAAKSDRQRRALAFQEQQDATKAEAAELVLAMSDHARAVLERDALAELEAFRERLPVARFDEMVCNTLPLVLMKLAGDRPLVDVVAEIEGRVVAA